MISVGTATPARPSITREPSWASIPRAAWASPWAERCRLADSRTSRLLPSASRPRASSDGGALLGALVPGRARVRAAVAGAGVADDERAHHLGMRQVEGERDVAAQGEAADHRALDAQVAQQRVHVAHREVR